MSETTLSAIHEEAANTVSDIVLRADNLRPGWDVFAAVIKPFLQRAFALGKESAPSSGEAATERATVTERDAVLRERAAADCAIESIFSAIRRATTPKDFRQGLEMLDYREYAAKTYPLPKVSRPLRVTLSDGSVWSYEPSRETPLFIKHIDGRENIAGLCGVFIACLDAQRFLKLAQIMSGETETVSEDTP